MPPEKTDYTKRSQYFIKKEFQFRFIIKFCLLILLGVIISTGLLFLVSQDTLTSSFQNSRLVIKSTASTILPAVIITNLVTLGFITLATIAVTLFVSHKIAGPMFRIERGLKEVSSGDLTQNIRLRNKDQITALAENFNIMTTNLHDRVQEIRNEVELLIDSASESNASEELIAKLKQLNHKIGNSFII